MLGVSSILAALNIVVTIFNMRAPGMTLMQNAFVCLELGCYQFSIVGGHAGSCRLRYHDVDGPSFPYQFF